MYGVWYNYLIEKLNFSNELVNILKKIGSYLNYLFINRFCEEGDIVMRKNDFPNDEQLRVFISSAQSNEGGLAWGEVRCKIKDYLKECPYLNPFIIEDYASIMPSSQFYQMQLIRADIVVLLVRGEVRNGTATEYALAIKHKKPMLIYFLEDNSMPELSAVSLKNNVKENDYCTYRLMSDFDNIEKVVRKDIIENVIRYFQNMNLKGNDQESDTETMFLSNIAQQSKNSIPTKTDIALFSSCYNHIFDLLGLPQLKGADAPKQSLLHEFGVAALDWLITGQGDVSDKDILYLINCVSDLYSDTKWLNRRWDAIRHKIVGDINDALIAENQALSLAKNAEMPPWIIANILIDCRNFENEIFAIERKPFYNGKGQKELDELNTIVYLPVLDRYVSNIFETLANETKRIKMAKPGTILMGTSIVSVINDVENYFFVAMLYGSYSHMMIARDLLVKVLYQYDELTGKDPLLFNCVKILVLNGDGETFKTFIDHRWDDMYLSITSNADKLWRMANEAIYPSKEAMKRAVITKLGMYMTDACFVDVEAYLKDAANFVRWDISEDFFDCIYQNIERLNPIGVAEMLTEIIREQHFHLGRKLTDILMYLKVEDVSYEVQVELCKVLEEKVEFIVSNGGHPQFIAALVNKNKEVFEVLALVPNNGLNGSEKLFYDINIGNGDWNQMVSDQVKRARYQFEANKNLGAYCGFLDKPYLAIKNAIRKHCTTEMIEIINDRLIPLCVEVLNSQTSADIKNDCIDCLCDALVYTNNGSVIITQELVEAIEKIDVSKTISFIGNSKSVLFYRILMLKIIIGTVDKDEILEWCFDVAKKDNSTRVALVECMEQYIRCYIHDPTKIDAMIISIIFQCFEDEYWIVRRIACNCLAKMLVTSYKDRVERKLYDGAIDPSHYVRKHLLIMCINGEIKDKYVSERITDILKNDANYAIRTLANK